MTTNSLPYENTSTGDRAIQEIQKFLQRFGCSKVGHMLDYEAGELMVQFEHHGRRVSIKASFKGYAAAWLKVHPHSYRVKLTRQEYEKKALAISSVAVYSILRDWIKGQVMAIEVGMLSFEGAFLGQILLPSGQTVVEYVEEANLLPAPGEAA